MLSKILTIFKKKLSKTRKFIFGNYREHVLSKTICHEIEKLEKIKKSLFFKPVAIKKMLQAYVINAHGIN